MYVRNCLMHKSKLATVTQKNPVKKAVLYSDRQNGSMYTGLRLDDLSPQSSVQVRGFQNGFQAPSGVPCRCGAEFAHNPFTSGVLAQEENAICGNDDSDRDVARAAVISLSHSSDEAAWDKNPHPTQGSLACLCDAG